MAKKNAVIDPSVYETLHIYVRVSTATQEKTGTSIDTQKERGIKKAKELEYKYKIWDEGGKSSRSDDLSGRPKLRELLELIKDDQVKHIWVYDQTRLARNDSVASLFRYECDKHGVTIHTNSGTFDLSDANDMLMKQFLDAISEFDNKQRAEKTRTAKLKRAAKGFWHGGPPPFGYKIVDKKLQVDPLEAKAVKLIFKEVIKGTSLVKIKAILDARGVIPRRKKENKTWSIGSLAAMIKNTHFYGEYKIKGAKSPKPIDVTCADILDRPTWDAAQQARKIAAARRPQQSRTTKNFYLLRDLMFCSHCGRTICGRIKKSKHEAHYYCPNKERNWAANGGTPKPWQRGTGCGMDRSMNIPTTDTLVWETVKRIHKDSRILRDKMKKQFRAMNDLSETQDGESVRKFERGIKDIARSIGQLNQTIAQAEVNRSTKVIDEETYQVTISRLNLRKAELSLAHRKAERDKKGEADRKKYVDWYKAFGEQVAASDTLSPEQRHGYLKELIERIDVKFDSVSSEHELKIHFHLPIVGDKYQFHDPSQKRMGGILTDGSHDAVVRIAKKPLGTRV